MSTAHHLYPVLQLRVAVMGVTSDGLSGDGFETISIPSQSANIFPRSRRVVSSEYHATENAEPT